jgi:methionine synthase I (cobalamin-dependent)
MRSRRKTFGCNLVDLGDYDIADKIRELALKGTAIAKRGSAGRPHVG